VTKKGKKLGGRPFDKATLYMLLTNPMLTGKIKHNGELYEGEHEAIIDQETFDQVQHQLSLNGRTGGAEVRNKYGAILKGLLRCKCCEAAMCHTFSGSSKKAFHRYYRCSRAIKSGRQACTVGTLPAAEIERVVVDEVRRLGTDKALLAEVLKDAHVAIDAELAELRREHDELVREAKRHHTELRQLIEAGNTSTESMNRIADLNQQTAEADRRLPELEQAIAELEAESVSQAEAQKVFGDFDGLWDSLIPREQARLLKLMLTVVEYDGDAGTVAVTFRTTSIRTLITQRIEEAA
jgi:site-specific DNA recombinase